MRHVADFDLTNQAFAGALRDGPTFKAWFPPRGDINTIATPDLPLLRSRSADLFRGNPIAAAYALQMRKNVLGTGLTLQSEVDADVLGISIQQAKELSKKIEKLWESWASKTDCSHSDRQTLSQLATTVLFSYKEAGDCFVSLPYDPGRPFFGRTIQLIDANRISTPTQHFNNRAFVDGMEFSSEGRLLNCWVLNQDGQYNSSRLEWVAYNAQRSQAGHKTFLQIVDLLKPSQARGIPFLSVLMGLLKDVERFVNSEVTAAVVTSYFTGFITSPGGGDFAALKMQTAGTETFSEGQVPKLGPAILAQLEPGQSISFANPTRPNAQFTPFMEGVGQMIGAALGIPWEVLRSFYNSSYSASRAALLDAWKTFLTERSLMVEQFYRPIYNIWFYEAVLKGYIQAPGFLQGNRLIQDAYMKANWIGPMMQPIDPEKEANAAVTRIKNELSTLANEAAATGLDWEDVHRQRVFEEQLIQADKTDRIARYIDQGVSVSVAMRQGNS